MAIERTAVCAWEGSLASGAGAFDQSALTALLTHTEEIDLTASGVDGNLAIDANFIQSVVGAGNSSHLTLRYDGSDTINITGANSQQSGNDYIFYSDSTMQTEIARVSLTT